MEYGASKCERPPPIREKPGFEIGDSGGVPLSPTAAYPVLGKGRQAPMIYPLSSSFSSL